MTDSDWRKLRRDRVARPRAIELETAGRRASALLHAVLDSETDLKQHVEAEAQVILMRDYALEAGTIEFEGRVISCLVRSLSEQGAALDVLCARAIPDRFTLELPLEGLSYKCHLVWRREMEIGVSFQ